MSTTLQTAFRITDPSKHGINTTVAVAVVAVVAIIISSSISIQTFAPDM